MTDVWGIHNDKLTTELIDGGFVSIGWTELGDLTQVGSTREDFKHALGKARPEATPRSIAAQAGVPFRFAYEMRKDDVVVAPYRPDSTINIGIVAGPYYYVPGSEHPHRRPVQWKKLGIARAVFSQSALNEVGTARTLFSIRSHHAEFLAVLNSAGDTSQVDQTAVEQAPAEEAEEPFDEPRASRVDRFTRDFVLGQLKAPKLQHREFEEFAAALLRAVGYQARVTPYSQDGGVDVIAHRDPLGIEPPLIKVQCKHTTATIGAPQVQQLIGTLAANELAVFLTLGNYSADALSIERQQQRLRLLGGEALVDLVLANYNALAPEWRQRIPLRQLLVVEDPEIAEVSV